MEQVLPSAQETVLKVSSHLTVRQAAVVVGVSPNTLRAWDHAGKLRAKRHPVNGYRLYDPQSLRDFLRRLEPEVPA